MKPVIDFNIELKLPDDSVPLYTAEDYMRDTNNGSRKDYDRMLEEAKARGQGFGFTYMSAVEKSVNSSAWADYNRIRKEATDHEVYVNFERTGELLNTTLETTYKEAAAAMQLYILKNDGVIDCWPDATSASTFDFYNIKKGSEENTTTKVGINYFASKIEKKSDDDGTHYYRPYEPFYRNACTYINSPEMMSTDKKIKDLMSVRTYAKGEKFKNNSKHIIAALPLILAVIAVLLMAFWRIAGIDAEAFVNGIISWNVLGKIGSFLMFIPELFLVLISLIYKFLVSTTALIIADVILLGAGLSGYATFSATLNTDGYWITKKAVLKGIEAQNELNAIKESEDYKRILKENGEYIKLQQELGAKWHRAWYERVKNSVYFMKNA